MTGLIQIMLEYLKHRRLRFDILTIFLSIFALSFTFVIVLTYRKNSESIVKFSTGEMKRISEITIEKVNDLLREVQLIPAMTTGILENLEHPSLNNPEIQNYMLDTVKNYQRVYAFYISKTDGTYIEVINLALSKQGHYVANPQKPLPADAIYSFSFIDRSVPNPVDHWEYKNKDFRTVGEEEVAPVTFDPRTRPWFIGAKKNGEVFWTDVYQFQTPGVPTTGITVGVPVFSPAGELTYVIGLDLTITFLESFLKAQKVGKTGEAFIVDSQGELVIPKNLKDSKIGQKIITAAFNTYAQKHQNNFIFEVDGVKYLSFIKQFPVQIGKQWLITNIVPLDDLFADMIRAQIMITVISILILIFGIIVVIYFSKKISTPIVILAGEIDKIRQLNLESKLRVKSNIKEIQIMDTSIASMRSALGSFGRYVPKEIVKQLILKGDEIVLGGEKKEITVFFSDIAGFTSIAESVSTEVLISLLSDYFGPLSKIILENGGTIDKYIGDSIMAFWNAPLDIADHTAKACTTALLCQYQLHLLNQKSQVENRPPLPTRIGINTGKAFIGNIGTIERMNYTAIGDVVNIAERLEQIGKEYHVASVISEDVYQKIKGQFLVRPLDRVAVKGRKEKINIYELVAKKEGTKEILATQQQIQLCREFTDAYEAFENDRTRARTLFKALHGQFPQDYPTELYLERLKNL